MKTFRSMIVAAPYVVIASLAAMTCPTYAQHVSQKESQDMTAPSSKAAREKVVRAFLLAHIQNDKEALRSLVLPTSEEDLDLLTRKMQAPPSETKPSSKDAKLREMIPEATWKKMIISEIRFSRIRTLKPGEIVPLQTGGNITVPEVPPGVEGVYMKHANVQAILLLVKKDGEWLVDTKPLIAARKKLEAIAP